MNGHMPDSTIRRPHPFLISMDGHMPDSTSRRPQPVLIGDETVTSIRVEGVRCPALLDTGSNVTTISRGFVDRHLPGAEVKQLNDLLTIHAAGGGLVEYEGYLEL